MKPSVVSIRPLSPAQKDFLGGYLKDRSRHAYTSQWIGFYGETIDPKALCDAWNTLVQRHGILRTAFDWENAARPIQVEISETEVNVPHHQLEDLLELESFISKVKDIARVRSGKGFNIKKPPLMDFEVVNSGRFGAIIWSRHHLITDGWSLSQLYGELLSEYSSSHVNTEDVRSYAHFIDALTPLIDKHADTEYWRKYLKNNHRRTYVSQEVADRSESAELDLGKEITNKIKQLCKETRITVNTFFVATLLDSLCRLFGSDAACVGMTQTLSGITEHEEQIIGPKITTLPIYGTLLDSQQLGADLIRLHKTLISHRSHSLAAIKDICNEQTGLTKSYNDLLNICYVFQNYPLDFGNTVENCPRLIHEIDDSEPGAPILIVAEPGETNTKLKVISKDQALIELGLLRLLDQWKSSITRVLGLSSYIYFGPTKYNYSYRSVARLGTNSLMQDVNNIAQADPSRPALIHEDVLMTYGELWERIESRSTMIDEACCGRKGLVIVKGIDDIRNIVDILSVWHSGRGHIAVDSDMAAWDLFRVYQRDVVVGCIGEKEIFGKLGSSTEASSVGNHESLNGFDDEIAYAVLTSGTTGKPKLIAISQQNVQAHLDARSSRYCDSDKVLLSYPLVFDGSMTVLFSALKAGATIVLPSRRSVGDVKRMLSLDTILPLIYTHHISALNIVPSLFRSLVAIGDAKKLESVRHVVLAAELLTAEDWNLFDEILHEDVEVWNEYGPSETTVCATQYQLQRKKSVRDKSVPIGKAIKGAEVRILDEEGRSLGQNEEGEIVVFGPIVGMGYLGDTSMARSAFFTYTDNSRVVNAYKTGDLGFINEQNDIVWTGRKDNQIKINGIRINSAEIESYLRQIRGVAEVITLVSKVNEQMPLIVSFAVLHPSQSKETWLTEAATALRARHLDHRIMVISEIPRLKSGKIDRQKLLALANNSTETGNAGDSLHEENIDLSPTQSEKLDQLIDLFKEVLKRQDVSANSDFFELGGSSLTAMTLAALTRKRLNHMIEVTDVYEFTTPFRIAAALSSIESRSGKDLSPVSAIKKKNRW